MKSSLLAIAMVMIMPVIASADSAYNPYWNNPFNYYGNYIDIPPPTGYGYPQLYPRSVPPRYSEYRDYWQDRYDRQRYLNNRIRAAQMKAAEMKAAEVRAARVRAAQMKAAEMKAAEVRAAQVKAAQMKAAQLKTAQAKRAGSQ